MDHLFYYWGIADNCPKCLLKEYIKKHSQCYTGLKDKNGKEIYEGDILEDYWIEEAKCILGKIVWEDFSWKIITENSNCCLDKSISNYYIVGNIYENPELINQGE